MAWRLFGLALLGAILIPLRLIGGGIEPQAVEVLSTLVEAKNFTQSLAPVKSLDQLPADKGSRLAFIESYLEALPANPIYAKYGLLKHYATSVHEFLKAKKSEWGLPADQKFPFAMAKNPPASLPKAIATPAPQPDTVATPPAASPPAKPRKSPAPPPPAQTIPDQEEAEPQPLPSPPTRGLVAIYRDGFRALADKNHLAAVKYFEELVYHFPSNPRGHYWLSEAHKRLGNFREAEEWLKKAMRLRPADTFFIQAFDTLKREADSARQFAATAPKTPPTPEPKLEKIERLPPASKTGTPSPKTPKTVRSIPTPLPTPTLPPPSANAPTLPIGEATLKPGSSPRRIAVMIENHPAARPQSGLGSADLVFEMPVEGRISRFMVVFENLTPNPVLGPVRSARHYFVQEASALNACYYHCGGSPKGYDTISSLKINSVDEIKFSQPFFRDKSRKAPHNLYTRLANLVKDAGDRGWALSVDNRPEYLTRGTPSTPGTTGTGFEIVFHKKNYRVGWTYEPGNGLYSRSINGVPHLDKNDSTPITARNVLVLAMKTQVVDKSLRIEMDNKGQGNAWFFANGRLYSGSWVKERPQSLPTFYLANGEIMKFPEGRTWVQVIDPEFGFTIEGQTTLTKN